MKATNYFGYKCPRGHTRITMGIQLGGEELLCPTCHTPMVPDNEATPGAANVYCPKCDAAYGMLLLDRCPECGGSLGRMPTGKSSE